MMIAEFVAPQCPQVHAPPPQPPPVRLGPVDERILQALRIRGRYGAGTWEVLNAIAGAEAYESRAELRSARLALWARLRGLLTRGVVYRQGRKRVSVVRLPQQGVRRRRRARAGSTVSSGPSQTRASRNNYLSSTLLSKEASPPTTASIPHKTQSVEAPSTIPTTDNGREAIRRAAVALAKLPRGAKRKLSGFAGTTRLWRGRPILVAGSTPAYALGATKQKIVFCLDPALTLERGRWGVIPASAVTILKNQSAVVLGQRKKGRIEKPSPAKRRAARINGTRPCKRGARGRPRTRWTA